VTRNERVEKTWALLSLQAILRILFEGGIAATLDISTGDANLVPGFRQL
jgi:hypothetical protein